MTPDGYIESGSTPTHNPNSDPTMSDSEPTPDPMRLVLTPEQRAIMRRLSGQNIDAIELEPEDTGKGGGPLRFLWRLSSSSGIPRQAWADEPEEPPAGEK